MLGACQVSVELYSERITAEALPLFPINSLRNQVMIYHFQPYACTLQMYDTPRGLQMIPTPVLLHL